MSWGGRGRKPDQLWLLLQTRPARTGTTGTAHSVPTQGAGPVGGRQLCRVDPTTLVSAENCANSALRVSLSSRQSEQSRCVRIRDLTKAKPQGVESGCVKGRGHMVIRVGLRVGQAG